MEQHKLSGLDQVIVILLGVFDEQVFKIGACKFITTDIDTILDGSELIFIFSLII